MREAHAARAGERFDPEIASLRTWLFAILRNVVIDLGRARAARPLPVDGTRVEAAVEPRTVTPAAQAGAATAPSR